MTRLEIAICLSTALSGTACIAQNPTPTPSEKGGVLTVVGMPPSAPSIYSGKQVKVLYGNRFRFDLGAQTTQTPIGAAALPGSLGMSAAAIAKLPSAMAQPAAVAPQVALGGAAPAAPPPPVVIPDYPEACDQADSVNIWPTDTDKQVLRITKCWNGIWARVNTEKIEISSLHTAINVIIRNAATEQRCYATNLWNFRQPILNMDQATALVALEVANATPDNPAGCQLSNSEAWPLARADQDTADLTLLQQQLSDLGTALGYPSWANGSGVQASNTALLKAVTDMITEVTSYSTGTATAGSGSSIAQTSSDFQTVVTNNRQWRKQLYNITSLSSLEIDITIAPCQEFYGKGRTDAVKLHAVDLSSTAGVSQDIQLATNTCNPRTIASTGIGISFLPSPVYSFVPADNTGAQVIGQTATNNQAPLYAVFYNVQLRSLGHGMELFASPGVGLTSASSTTNSDILGGLSISFARRVLFLTPAIDFGRRDQLVPGFSIGTPKGSLSSVPTQSHWPVQFMLSISFGIGPS